MQLITNTDLAQQIIARYTTFLSIAASGADLTFLSLPSLEGSQASFGIQRQELHHIHNCIEQNTLVSVNLNLQFLTRMVTQAVRQFSAQTQRAVQMVERPILLERPTQTRIVRVDAPATRTLLRELQQRTVPGQTLVLQTAAPGSPAPTQLPLENPSIAPPPKVQLVSPSKPAPPQEFPHVSAQNAPLSAQHPAEKAASLPAAQSAELLPLLREPLPRRSTDRRTPGGDPLPAAQSEPAPQPTSHFPAARQTAESPRTAMQAPTPLVHPAAVAPIARQTAANLPAARQTAESPRTAMQAPTPPVHPATAAPIAQQTTATLPAARQMAESPRTAMQAPTPLVHPAAAAAAVPIAQQTTATRSAADVQMRTTANLPAARQAAEAPRTAMQAPTPLVHPAASPAPQQTTSTIPAARQTAEAPRTAMQTPTPLVHPAASPASQQTTSTIPAARQTVEAPRTAMQTAAPMVHPAASPVSPQTTSTRSAAEVQLRTAATVLAARQAAEAPRTAVQTAAPLVHPAAAAPIAAQAAQAAATVLAARQAAESPHTAVQAAVPLVHPAAAAPGEPQTTLNIPAARRTALPPRPVTPAERTALKIPITRPKMIPASPAIFQRAALLYSAMKTPAERLTAAAPMASPAATLAAPQPSALPLHPFGISSRTDSPAPRVLRAEPQRQKSTEPEDDSMEIPTIQVKKSKTQESRQETIKQNVAVNLPQEHPAQTLLSAPQEALAEVELTRITDKVYRAIESRLRSEKMRRGMW